MTEMGWQQYLTNASVPLKQRLQGARVAFFSSSAELSTHQKEDVVIQWLTRLVKEKQASTWQEDVCQEQEAVWQLLSAVFSSKRLQVLINHRWTCPITSAFPQSIINVLGSSDLSPVTQKCIVDTLHTILRMPALSSVITNSSSLSLNVTTTLLDLAIATDWSQVADAVLCARGDIRTVSSGDGGQPWIKRLKVNHQLAKKKLLDERSTNVNPIFSVEHVAESELIDEEKVLHALTLLLGDVKLQMLARGVEAMTICSHQLLKRVAVLKISFNSYNEILKSQVLKQLDALVSCCLFNAEVFPQYEVFLSQLMIEDGKIGQKQSAVHIVLSMFSDVVSQEPVPVVRYVTSLFMRGFLDRCVKNEHILKMLATLLYIAGISVPGDNCIDPNNLVISLIDRKEISVECKEAVIWSLMKVLHSSKLSVRSSLPIRTYIKSLVIYLSVHHQPITPDGFRAFQYILLMYFMNLGDDFPPVLGRLITWKKSSEEVIEVYRVMLLDLVKWFLRVHNLGMFVGNLLCAIVLAKDDLKSHEEFLPSPAHDLRGSECMAVLPPRFLNSLAGNLKGLEPKEYCSLLELVLDTMEKVVLPLTHPADGVVEAANLRAVTLSCWLAGAVVVGGAHHRAVRVEGCAATLVAIVKGFLGQLLHPLLKTLITTVHDNGICCGVLMLCQAWNHLHHVLLRSQSTYSAEWLAASPPSADDPSVLVPYTSAKTWTEIEERLEKFGDEHAKTQLLRLLVQRLSHLTEEKACLEVQEKSAKDTAADSADSGNGSVDSRKSRRATQKGNDKSKTKKTLATVHTQKIQTPAGSSDCSQAVYTLTKLLMQLLQQWPNEASSMLLSHRPTLLFVLPVATYHKKLAHIVLDNYSANADIWRKALQEDSPQNIFYGQMVSLVLSELVSCIKGECSGPEQTKKRKRQSYGDGELFAQRDALLQEIIKNIDKFATEDESNFTKKLFNAKSATCGKSLIEFIELLNSTEIPPSIAYKHREKVANLLLLLKDIPINSSNSKQRVFSMMALLVCFFCTDLSKEKLDDITQLMLGILNQYMMSGLQMMFAKSLDLPCLINRVVVQQQQLPPDTVEDGGTNTGRSSLVLQVNTFLQSLSYQLVHSIYKVESVQRVSSFIINRAKQACAETGPEEEEKFLRPAWALVLACSQSLDGKSNLSSERLRWCKKTVRSIGSWCVRLLHRLDLRTVSGVIAAHGLAIFTALVRVEARDCETASTEDSVETETSATANSKEGVRITANEVAATTVMTPGWAESDAGKADNLDQTANGLDETLNTTFEGAESGRKTKRWQRYMDDGVQLAKVCLASKLPALEATAMCFIIALKMLPIPLQQQLPQDMFRYALRFFTKAPSDKAIYAEAYSRADAEQLSELAEFKPRVLKDLVSDRPILLNTFLADCPMDVFQGLLDDLLSRSVKLDDGLFPHTASLWNIIINTHVDDRKTRAKRSVMTTLVRTLVWHLSLASASQAQLTEENVALGLKGSVMVCLLELFITIIKTHHSLPHQTTVQTVMAASVSTEHLPLLHFVKVWQCQVSLLDAALLTRSSAWPDRVAGLLVALQSLFEQLVARSDQDDPIAQANKEALTGCCLCLERLVRRLEPLGKILAPVVHHTLGAMVTALHRTIVIAPVKSVLDQQIHQLIRLCERNCLDHLMVALPAETRPLLQYYHQNHHKYYAFQKKKE